MDVELTKERRSVITQKLAPLARLLPNAKQVEFDVVIRKIYKTWGGERYCVSVRLSTEEDKYYSIATEPYLEKSFSKVREELRKTISKSYRVQAKNILTMQRFIKERQYLELFA